MNPTYLPTPRETQTLRCCGHLYRRWRFAGKKFSVRCAERCSVCGGLLNWPSNYTPVDRKKRMMDAWYDRAVNFLLQGLTTHGKPRRRRAPFVHRVDTAKDRQRHLNARQAAIRASLLKSYHARANRFASQGLTSRGTVPKRHKATHPVLDQWQAIRSQLGGQVDWAEDFERIRLQLEYPQA